MRQDIFLEQNIDAPDYISVQNIVNMEKTDCSFASSRLHQNVELFIVYKGCMRCTVNHRVENITAGSVFVVNSYDTYSCEYVGNASTYFLVIGREYFSHILSDTTEFNNFLHLRGKVWEELISLLQEVELRFEEMNTLQKRGFVNFLFGILSDGCLFRKKQKDLNKEFFACVSEYIREHYNENLTFVNLAEHFGYSPNYFSSLFNRLAGEHLNDYINRIRIQQVLMEKQKLGQKYTLRGLVQRAGFNSIETYYRALKRYRSRQMGEMHIKEKEEKNNMEKENGNMLAKKLTATIVGYGNRGQVYADYSLDCPNELGIIAVVDTNDFKLEEAKKRYNLLDEQLFHTLEEFLAQKIECDLVINTTMDQIHHETSMRILEAGYDMLLEKPIVPNEKELMDIHDKAKEKNCNVFICHVLRYTPFYRRIKELILQGEIGDIVSMEMSEHVCTAHYLTAFVRGKWNSEEKCGSGFLLAKCCHDLDIMCWLNNATEPDTISSMGSRSQFVKGKKPEGAAEFCYQCKYERDCPYSAIRLYMELNAMPFLTWDRLNKPLDEITNDEKMEFLRSDIYGKCAYDNLGDLVDRQNLLVTFKDGSICSFTLVGGTTKADRFIHIIGTVGEIEGKVEEDKFLVRKYAENSFTGSSRVVNVKEEIISNARFGGHSGGDFGIMHDLIAYLNGDESSVSITKLEDSINGHLCIFAAEKSRKEGRFVKIEEVKSKQK